MGEIDEYVYPNFGSLRRQSSFDQKFANLFGYSLRLFRKDRGSAEDEQGEAGMVQHLAMIGPQEGFDPAPGGA
ncbi:hypothetical protein TSH7_19125 [Azospirillum sp. TSH7]|nr:hypothetical protein TSH20_27860 [Azospirillum sp. TSH20]PWC60262.1 hypothetical protein TSH7_19125 [Azospirillum sp. TSH7]